MFPADISGNIAFIIKSMIDQLKKKSFQLTITLFIVLLVSGCSSVNNIETFYIGNGGIQYFITPLSFQSDNSKALIDVTIRDEKNKNVPVTVNFTVEFDEPVIRRIDSAGFIDGYNAEYPLTKLTNLFREIKDKKIRYTSSMEYDHFKKVFMSDTISFVIYSPGKNVLTATKQVYKKAKDIRLEILETINQ